MALALRTSVSGADIFDRGLVVPEDPVARGKLSIAALDGVGDTFETAANRAFGSASVASVYERIKTDGVEAMARQLASNGFDAANATRTLDFIQSLIDQAGSFQLLPNNAAQQFYVTDAGAILTHPNEDAPTELGTKIDRLHHLAIALSKLPEEQLDDLPDMTRAHLLTALTELRDNALSPTGEGERISTERTPALAIPDNAGWVSDSVDISESGRIADLTVKLDLTHTYIGDLTVELVSPDRDSVTLHGRTGRGADDIKKSFTLDDDALASLKGKEINGNWRIRIQDSARRDVGTLNKWSLDIKTVGGNDTGSQVGEARVKALYAGAGAISRRLATIGDTAEKTKAFSLSKQLVQDCPYRDVQTIMLAALAKAKSKLASANKTTLENDLLPIVIPGSPNYDAIFQISYDENGQMVAGKRELNFAVMYGSEEDDLIYTGGIQMMKDKGFVEVDSDKSGYKKFTKKVNQDDPSAPCQVINTYVAHMNGRNMFQAMGDADIDVIQYDGHSNLGRNIENSLKNAPEQVGHKVVVMGACATTDRAFMVRNKYQDSHKAQLVNTYESTYFNHRRVDGKKVMTYSENMMCMFSMQQGMADLKGWTGRRSLADTLKLATHSWGHTVDVNFTNPGKLEWLMLTDLDKNGLPDGSQGVWDGGRIKADLDVRNEFKAKAPTIPANRLDASNIFEGAQSTDTMGRYNIVTKNAYNVRTIRSQGYDATMGPNDPIVKVTRGGLTGDLQLAVNPHHSHASVEAIRASAHFALINLIYAEGHGRQLNDVDKKIMSLLFAAGSLEYDNSYYDDRVWEGLLEHYNFPEGVELRDFSKVLHDEHERPQHELCGHYRNIEEVKERMDPEVLAKFADANVGKFAPQTA